MLLKENALQGKKIIIQSPGIYPPRKDSIPNQDIKRLITKQDPILPPIIEKFPPGYKPLFSYSNDQNSIEYDPKYYTNT